MFFCFCVTGGRKVRFSALLGLKKNISWRSTGGLTGGMASAYQMPHEPAEHRVVVTNSIPFSLANLQCAVLVDGKSISLMRYAEARTLKWQLEPTSSLQAMATHLAELTEDPHESRCLPK